MRVRRITLDTDYPIIKTWWERRGSSAPQKELLPITGIMAEWCGQPQACAFLYEDKGGTVAMIEWEATNPDCGPVATVKALNAIFDFFELYCQEKGQKVILSWVESGRGDGRLLSGRKWVRCPGERHELMAFVTEKGATCPP